jgi:GMP synthase (glutamine-hydrolysing)
VTQRLLIVNINPTARTLDGCRAIARGLRAAAPEVEVVIRHWRGLTPRIVGQLRPMGVVIGPNGTPFPAYPPAFDRFLGWVRARRGPTLGICGGHQALALAHGAPVGPVFRVPAATTSYAGMPKVQGETRVRMLGDPDPLLAGLPEEFTVAASHVDEVKEVPPGFRLLAIGDPCHIQVLRADRRPLWGVQFHPERPAGEGAAADYGALILANFAAICGVPTRSTTS